MKQEIVRELNKFTSTEIELIQQVWDKTNFIQKVYNYELY